MTHRAPRRSDFDIELKLLLEAVYLKYQHDFRHYAFASLRRRIRQAMERQGVATVSQLQDRLMHDHAVFTDLLQYFTVQVSEMFRDPGYFLAMREKVLPLLATYPFMKLWVAGCATGEEAWSFAIMLHEEGLLARALIYATDINPQALAVAEAGVYAMDRVARFSTSYLEAGGKASLAEYYTAAYGKAVFDKRLRKHVVFTDHSLATDSVFSEVELVSCRNVLIYFDRELQSRAIGLFHDALAPRGVLGIGSKETLRYSAYTAAFDEYVADQRIYRKR